MKKIACTIVIISLLGCGEETTKESPIENEVIEVDSTETEISELEPSVSFLHTYSLMTKALLSKKENEFDEFIHPKHGIKLITNFNGAMPVLMEYKNSSHFDHDEPVRLAFEKLDSLVLIEGIIEELPKVICDESIYEKEGCFAQETSNNLDQHPWNADGAYNELTETVKWTVVNTHNFTFYFSEIDDQFYLTFVDIRTHCAA